MKNKTSSGMDEEEYKLLKSKFLKIIANVPEPLRDEIIAIIEEEDSVRTYTWLSASAEIRKDTEKAPIILKHLKEMGVLENEK